MHTVRALLSLGLFGYLGYVVWTERLVGGNSSKSRAVGNIVELATDRFGVEGTAILLFGTGVILAFIFMILGARSTE